MKTSSLSRLTAALLALAVFSLQACSTDEPVATAGADIGSSASTDLHIRAVSTRPWLVTGGDVLLEISAAQAASSMAPEVSVNGSSVNNQLVQMDSSSLAATANRPA